MIKLKKKLLALFLFSALILSTFVTVLADETNPNPPFLPPNNTTNTTYINIEPFNDLEEYKIAG